MALSLQNLVSLTLASTVAWSACGPSITPEDETGSAGSGGGSSTTTLATTTTTLATTTLATTTLGTTMPPPEPDDTTGTTGDRDSFMFFDTFDGAGPSFECDLFLQDCPEGDKCMPWANDGGDVWNATRCSPIEPDPDAIGQSCTVVGNPASGLDSCEGGSMCWDVSLETFEGICTAFCLGTADDPTCEDPNAQCALEEVTGLALCLPVCNPLLQDCAEGQACYPVRELFLCVPDRSGDMGAQGTPCEYLNACDPGRACLDAEAVPMCKRAGGCCSPFCDLADPMPPCPPGQACSPWYDEGTAPAGYESVGACTVPT